MFRTGFGRQVSCGVRIGARTLGVAVLLVQAAGPQVQAQQTSAGTTSANRAAVVPASNGAAVAGTVTFAKDIAPILQKNCQQCHQRGAIGPMPLTTFDEVRPWARAIRQKVVTGEMPPYRYDRAVGIQNLKYDLRLSEAEIQKVARWETRGRLSAILPTYRRRSRFRIPVSGLSRISSGRRI